jgi:predicted PurR-regulated permease PerM
VRERRRALTSATVARVVAIAGAGIAAMWAMYLARGALLLIYISVLLAIGFGPVVRAIEHQTLVPVGTRRLPRWLAILVIYVAIVGTLTAVGLMVVPPLIDQAAELWRRLPELIAQGQSLLIRYGLLNREITLEEAVRNAPATGGNAVGTVAVAVTAVVGGIFGFLTILILTFYLLVESDSLFYGFARLFPRSERGRVGEAAQKISTKVSAWLNGQLILAGTIGASAAVGLWLIGVPYFYVLALVAAIGEMIPVIGPILAAIPAVAVAFSVSPQTALITVVFFAIQQQIENHLLVPKVMERQVGVSATTVIVALLVGGSLLGIMGALLAVPTAAIIQVVVKELLDERDRIEEKSISQ